jgi:hypothetical protein
MSEAEHLSATSTSAASGEEAHIWRRGSDVLPLTTGRRTGRPTTKPLIYENAGTTTSSSPPRRRAAAPRLVPELTSKSTTPLRGRSRAGKELGEPRIV